MTLLVLTFFVSIIYAQTSENKWEVKSVSGPSSLRVNATSIPLKIKVKNISNALSLNESLFVRVSIVYNDQNLGGDELHFTQGALSNIKAGKTTVLNVLVTNENFTEITCTKGTTDLSAAIEASYDPGPLWNGFGSITQDFTIKVK